MLSAVENIFFVLMSVPDETQHYNNLCLLV